MSHRNCSACTPPPHAQYKSYTCKNVLDIRMVSGNPQGAWIECYNNTFDEDAQAGIAEYYAQVENEKINRFIAEKEKKLCEFQQEVSKRVASLKKLKQLEKQKQSLKSLENEQNVVLQRTLGMKIPYRGTEEDLQALNKELLKSCIIPCRSNTQLIKSEIEESNQKIDEITQTMREDSTRAKTRLLSRMVQGEDLTSLPGGLWTSPAKQDSSISVHPPAKPPVVNWALQDTWTGDNAIKSCVDENKKKEVEENEQKGLAEKSKQKEWKKEEKVCCGDDKTIPEERFELSELQRNLIYDPVNIGQQAEQEKKQKKIEYWKYRKIFMDIEREQVRERRRRQAHKKLIERVKITKERERQMAEERATEFPEKILYADDTQHADRDVDDEEWQPVKNKQKEREIYRYINALREVAKERIKMRRVAIAPLCQCGPSIWDAHPTTCANNCIFHKNPKAYVTALTAALANSR